MAYSSGAKPLRGYLSPFSCSFYHLSSPNKPFLPWKRLRIPPCFASKGHFHSPLLVIPSSPCLVTACSQIKPINAVLLRLCTVHSLCQTLLVSAHGNSELPLAFLAFFAILEESHGGRCGRETAQNL